MSEATEIAYDRAGFVRVVHSGRSLYVVQRLVIRGQNKLGQLTQWKPLYTAYDRDKAIGLMETYAGHPKAPYEGVAHEPADVSR